MMGRFLHVAQGLLVAAPDDGLGRVLVLLLPRQRTEPQGARLSRQGKEGVTNGGQQRRDRGRKQKQVQVAPVRNQFMQRNPIGTQWRGAAHLQGRRHVEQTGLVELLGVHARRSSPFSVRRATACSSSTRPST